MASPGKDKIKLILITLVFLSVVCTFGFWLLTAGKKSFDPKELILIGPVILILILVIPPIVRNYRSVKDKTPFEDERSLKAKTRAAAMTFYISIYLLLALGWVGDSFFERPSQATGAGIMGMAITFLITWLYFEKKENL